MLVGVSLRAMAACVAAGISLAGCATVPSDAAVQMTDTVMPQGEDAMVGYYLERMSLERKIAQLIQPQINSFTAQDMERYRFGSYLNGGNGGPYGDEFAPASEWLRLADEMYAASVMPLPGGEPAVPVIWGTDAVHGHTNIVGATIFPHNIALGAAGDADLVRRIGHATAREIEVTGIDWNFSPTVAVARDDRWGRTYESYSENPELVARLGAALVEGQQGKRGTAGYLGDGRVIATAKHFFGDGGTVNGVDQGEVTGDIDALMAVHGVPYPAAIDAGVETIMASFNSINGRKMHGNEALLTDVLRGQMGFDGLVVGDWNGHAQVAGCTVTDCAQSLLAGLDIYMVPDDWRGLMETLISQVNDGTIPMARVEEAVSRVLRVKHRAGLLGPDVVRPSARGMAGQYDLLASPEHRSLAREAVARSQVILKNDGILPLASGADVLVAGSAADNVAIAAGGWTLEWQGMTEATPERFPNTTSIWDGVREAVEADGGNATLSADGSFTTRPDVAIVVFGEEPYAEFAGDRPDLAFRDEEGLELLREYKEQGIPTVSVFLSGRPLWMNREINASDAFVASWLPGSEGAGIADVLTGAREATGKLSFSWPANCDGVPVNGADSALFQVGYGRALSDVSTTPVLSEECNALTAVDATEFFASGRLGNGILAYAYNSANAEGPAFELDQLRGNGGGVTARGVDRNAQEDAREIMLSAGSGMVLVSEISSTQGFRITYSIDNRPIAPVTLFVGDHPGNRRGIDITQALSIAEGKGYREMLITSACAPGEASDIAIEARGNLTLRIGSITRVDTAEDAECVL